MDLTSHILSTPSSAPISVPFTTAFTTGILQVNDRSRSVAYFFWVTFIADLNASKELYQEKIFKILVIPVFQEFWVLQYGSSHYLTLITTEETSGTPATVIPNILSDMLYCTLLLERIGTMGNNTLNIFGFLTIQAPLSLQ